MGTLTSLDLSHNPLPGAEGGSAVAGLLGAASKLRQLQLSHTGLGDEGEVRCAVMQLRMEACASLSADTITHCALLPSPCSGAAP
jgi:hypothetical protein